MGVLSFGHFRCDIDNCHNLVFSGIDLEIACDILGWILTTYILSDPSCNQSALYTTKIDRVKINGL